MYCIMTFFDLYMGILVALFYVIFYLLSWYFVSNHMMCLQALYPITDIDQVCDGSSRTSLLSCYIESAASLVLCVLWIDFESVSYVHLDMEYSH